MSGLGSVMKPHHIHGFFMHHIHVLGNSGSILKRHIATIQLERIHKERDKNWATSRPMEVRTSQYFAKPRDQCNWFDYFSSFLFSFFVNASESKLIWHRSNYPQQAVSEQEIKGR